jgi:hypothetical protein
MTYFNLILTIYYDLQYTTILPLSIYTLIYLIFIFYCLYL